MRARNIALRSNTPLHKDVLRHAASGSISVYVADREAGISFEFCTEHAILPLDHRPRMLESTPLTRDLWLAGPSAPATPVEQLGVTMDGPDDRFAGEIAEAANSLA